MPGIVFDIKRYAIHDGPGIRTAVFLKGCPLRCLWCHNPESRRPRPEPMRRAHAVDEADCDIVGYETTAAEVLREVERDLMFFDESGGGLTISGGEPLFQPEFVLELLQEAHRLELHTVLDTTGFAPWPVLDRIRPYVSLFLYDLKLMDDARHREVTGVSNRLILENLRSLDAAGHDYWVRIPVVPGINDDDVNMEATARFVAGLKRRAPVYLLPFHPAANQKYDRLGMENPLRDLRGPDDARLAEIREIFQAAGLEARAGF